MIIALRLLAACFIAAAAAPALPDDSAPVDEPALTGQVVAVMAARKIPGAQVAIVLPDGAIWERSFGLARSRIVATDDARYA